MEFDIIDTKTGQYPDVEKIALKEEWAKHLIYCDIDGFYIGEDGALLLVDDCGNSAFCPAERFEVTIAGKSDRWQAKVLDASEDTEQMTLFPEAPKEPDGCYACIHFAELKEPFSRSDGSVIYGYCFKDGDTDYSRNMGKGYAVFISAGKCKHKKRKTLANKVASVPYGQ